MKNQSLLTVLLFCFYANIFPLLSQTKGETNNPINKSNETQVQQIKKKPTLKITSHQARTIAQVHLYRCRTMQGWDGAFPGRVFPLFTSENKNHASYFEVKVSTPDQEHAGAIIISATDINYPILGFTTTGRTLSERIISNCGKSVIRIIWHGLGSATAEDEKGIKILSIGRKPQPVFEKKEFEKFKKKHKIENIPSQPPPDKEKEKEWEEIKAYLSGIKKIGNPSITAASWGYVWGWSRHANLDQYDLPSGAPVGCGPTAWAALLSYLDMYWDPDLLYGTHDYMSDYIKRLMKLFHDEMGTVESGMFAGLTFPQAMELGYDAFKDYNLFGYYNPQGNFEYDLNVCIYGTEPNQALVNFVLSKFNSDNPLIVGIALEPFFGIMTSGHYALGLGWGLNANGQLKWILIDKLWGNGLDDLWWWHRSALFGAWAIPRGSYSCTRQFRDISLWNEIDMASLEDEIYAVGRKPVETWPDPEPMFVLGKTNSTGYPLPEKGLYPAPKLAFSETIEIPVSSIQGQVILPDESNPFTGSYPLRVSTCTWKCKVQFWDWLAELAPRPHSIRIKNSKITVELFKQMLIDMGKKVEKGKGNTFDVEKKTYLKNRKLFPEKPNVELFPKSIELPYLFLVWRDFSHRIHIAYTVITENMENYFFSHVLLPERFIAGCDPDITIAKDGNTGPMLYIAYADENGYFGSGQFISNNGRLLIIDLDTFFEIARTGQDLWPQNPAPDIIETTETIQTSWGPREVTTIERFKHHWCSFWSANVEEIRVCSNGKKVALLWKSHDKFNIYWSYTFTGDYRNNYPYMTFWGDCRLYINYAKYGHEFLESADHITADGDYWVGTIRSAGRPDLLYGTEGTLFTYRDPYNRLLVGKVSATTNPRRAHLLADFFETGRYPSINFIKDKLNNNNIVLAWLGMQSPYNLTTRILYLSGSGVPGISDFDNLPK